MRDLKQETSSFVGILVFMKSWNFVLSWVEHEKSFTTSGPDIPCLADAIAEPRPGINIKVAAFTVSEKSINTKSRLAKMHYS